ncbi:uncharacterized protein J3R85_011203 [Psidium guajava]|nr:uncharacterized protein J3R85_011203 [Psidium guajava]
MSRSLASSSSLAGGDSIFNYVSRAPEDPILGVTLSLSLSEFFSFLFASGCWWHRRDDIRNFHRKSTSPFQFNKRS